MNDLARKPPVIRTQLKETALTHFMSVMGLYAILLLTTSAGVYLVANVLLGYALAINQIYALSIPIAALLAVSYPMVGFVVGTFIVATFRLVLFVKGFFNGKGSV